MTKDLSWMPLRPQIWLCCLAERRCTGFRSTGLGAATAHHKQAPNMRDAVTSYWHAKDAYDEAERALARARAVLTEAERERKKEWDRLVARAESLSDDE